MDTGIAYAHMDSPIGPVWVATAERGICAVGLGERQPERFFAWLTRHMGPEPRREDPAALAQALAQLGEYFAGTRLAFDLELDARGTPFQEAVWGEIARIPYGTTITYGEIAQRIGRPRAPRAVGAAVGANPLSILIPCHRVIGSGGTLTGYGGGLDAKAALLKLEGVLLR